MKINLTTKIIHKKTGKELAAYAEKTYKTVPNCAGDDQANIYAIGEDGRQIFVGVLVYSRKEGHIYLEFIANRNSEYKHAGTAGIEYLLRIPGVNKITTDASYSSHAFYWALGFRIPAVQAKQVFDMYRHYEFSYDDYRSAKAENSLHKQAEYRQQITEFEDFDSLVKRAARCLGRELDKKKDFEAIMENGLYDDENAALEEEFRPHIEKGERIDTSRRPSMKLCLPEESFKDLQLKFKIGPAIGNDTNQSVSTSTAPALAPQAEELATPQFTM